MWIRRSIDLNSFIRLVIVFIEKSNYLHDKAAERCMIVQKNNKVLNTNLETVSAFGAYEEIVDWKWELGKGERFELTEWNADNVGPPGDLDLWGLTKFRELSRGLADDADGDTRVAYELDETCRLAWLLGLLLAILLLPLRLAGILWTLVLLMWLVAINILGLRLLELYEPAGLTLDDDDTSFGLEEAEVYPEPKFGGKPRFPPSPAGPPSRTSEEVPLTGRWFGGVSNTNTASRHFFTRSLSRLARTWSLTFRRNSFTVLPRRVDSRISFETWRTSNFPSTSRIRGISRTL